MKKALLIGCGSKWGASFTKHLADIGYHVDLLTSSDFEYTNVNTLKVNWYELNLEHLKTLIDNTVTYDLIFFNQNAKGSVSDFWFTPGNDMPIESWNTSMWLDCQLPYCLVKHLSSSITDDTKIGWMMTGLIVGNNPEYFKYAGYASHKATNLHIMRGFSQNHRGVFFALNPIWFPIEDYVKDSEQIHKVISGLKKIDSGKSFNKDGTEWI
jgi:hypothetical protein